MSFVQVSFPWHLSWNCVFLPVQLIYREQFERGINLPYWYLVLFLRNRKLLPAEHNWIEIHTCTSLPYTHLTFQWASPIHSVYYSTRLWFYNVLICANLATNTKHKSKAKQSNNQKNTSSFDMPSLSVYPGSACHAVHINKKKGSFLPSKALGANL